MPGRHAGVVARVPIVLCRATSWSNVVRARPRHLLVLVGVALLALNLRPGIIVISAVLPGLQHDLDMSSATAGVLGAAPPLAFGVFGALAPRAAKAVGLERRPPGVEEQ